MWIGTGQCHDSHAIRSVHLTRIYSVSSNSQRNTEEKNESYLFLKLLPLPFDDFLILWSKRMPWSDGRTSNIFRWYRSNSSQCQKNQHRPTQAHPWFAIKIDHWDTPCPIVMAMSSGKGLHQAKYVRKKWKLTIECKWCKKLREVGQELLYLALIAKCLTQIPWNLVSNHYGSGPFWLSQSLFPPA